jgi:hypothetical protein
MTPRLLVVCLGGLAGGGAMVCCDLNEGLEDEPEGPVDAPADPESAPIQAEADAVH